ncbi:MAG: DNA polymerase III subunit beta [Clostridia bacterium]|nr:DNA polymerase III subunit beta [Clostridia bacterium]
MKVIVRNSELSNAVARVAKAINNKNLSSALEGIKFSAKGDFLTLSATDNELAIEKTIPCETFMEGDALIPGKLINELVKNISDDEDVEIFVSENRAKIGYGSSVTDFQCLDVEEFPIIKKDYKENSFDIVQKDLKELISKTSFACATDIARPIYCGCLIEVEDDVISCVALDGFRMAYYKKQVSCVNGKIKAIIPQRTLQEIVKLGDDDTDIITIQLQDNFLMIEQHGTIIVSRLLTGQFIDYKKLINTNYTTNFTVNAKDLKNCIDRASIVAKDNRNVIYTSVKEGVFKIFAQSEIGQVNESLPITIDGFDVEIGFNYKNIADILSVSTCEFIKFSIVEADKPCFLTPMSEEDLIYMILPIRR